MIVLRSSSIDIDHLSAPNEGQRRAIIEETARGHARISAHRNPAKPAGGTRLPVNRRYHGGDRRVGGVGAPRCGTSSRGRSGRRASMAASRRSRAPAKPSPQDTLATRSFDDSQTINIEAKRAIARAAVDMCADGDVIIVNGGTTTYQMSEFLRQTRLKVLTNSYPLAEFLIHETQNRVALPGGEVYRDQKLIVAPFDDDAIQHYSARLMFMSALAIGPLGVIEGDPLIARAETKLLSRAEKLVVLADASKFEPKGSLVVCPLSRIERSSPKTLPPPAALAMLREAGVNVVIAPLRHRELCQFSRLNKGRAAE